MFSLLQQQDVPPGVYIDPMPPAGYQIVKSWDGEEAVEVYKATPELFDQSMPARMEQRLAVHLAKKRGDKPPVVEPVPLQLLA